MGWSIAGTDDIRELPTPGPGVAALLGHSSLTTTARYDRRARDRHLPAWLAGARHQAVALEAARRAALTRTD